MQRYSGSIEYVLNLNYKTGIELIEHAIEEKQKENLFTLYATIYPNMTEENFISFAEYIRICMVQKDTRTAEEIVKELSDLCKSIEWEEAKE